MDYTGTGNSLNVRHPHSLQLLMDSLRYWVTEMHVDGFRFDLASTLAREFYDVDKLSTFFELIQQDPIVSQVKLIAEPWDVGPGGYQVGNFPPQWTEWNGKYRDTVRDFWRGEPSTLGEFASRLTGSADLYESSARRPVASINFVTAHDGFTMLDLVSYNEKHNDANGEGNNDGESHNRSWNCGAEGDTDDDAVLTLRARQQRNFIATLLLSQGVPMILHGDELGRTQQGNNNTYCQDSELSWVHWDSVDQPLVEFTAMVNKIRRDHPIFRRSRFFDGRPVRRGEGEKLPDIVWLNTDGKEMLPEDWGSGFGRTIGVFYNGHGIQEQDSRGRRITDDSFLLAFNAHDDSVDFLLPAEEYSPFWDLMVNTADGDTDEPLKAGSVLTLAAKSLVVLRAYSGPEVEVDYSAAASLAARAEAPAEEAPAVEAPEEAPAEAPEEALAGDAPAGPESGSDPDPEPAADPEPGPAATAKAAPAKKPRSKKGPAS
jgi:glycogen operon protein